MIIVGIFLLEIAVGIVQLIGALVRTIICINTKKPIGKLKSYWIMTGIYFFIFVCLYFAEDYIMRNITINDFSDTANYLDKIRLYQYFVYAHVIWVFLAWGIATWYWIRIVFAKQKNNPIISESEIINFQTL